MTAQKKGGSLYLVDLRDGSHRQNLGGAFGAGERYGRRSGSGGADEFLSRGGNGSGAEAVKKRGKEYADVFIK